MNKLFAAIMLTCMSLSVTACTLDTPVVASAPVLIDDKALVAAELSFNTAAKTYLEMESNGQLNASTKATYKKLLNDAYKVLLVLRKTHSYADYTAFNTLIAGFIK